jgi:hypothetical protein
MKKLVSLICILTCLQAYGGDDVIHLDKGSPAPFSGFLITPDKADSIRNMKIDLDTANKVNAVLLDNQKIYEERVNNYKSHSEDLAKQVESLKDNSMLSKVGFFVLGAAVTGLVAYGTTRALK